jgi:arylsulfatase A-like enzyme
LYKENVMIAGKALVALSLSLATCTAMAGNGHRPKRAPPPNVILVITDDQGYGDLSIHGNPVLRTPNLDRLASESIRLIDFHVAPMCTPSRGQLLSGRDALFNGAMNVGSGRALLRRTLPTMANFFAGNGYRTGLFGKWHLGDNYPYRAQDRGFEETLTYPSSLMSSVADTWNNDYFDDFYRHNGEVTQYPGYCTDVFFAEAMRWIRQQAAAREPFFAYLAPNAAHWPYFVPQQYRQPYASLPAEQASFFGMIANIDENMGKLEQMLIQEGLRENTIVIFMTDNGTATGETVFNAGMRGKKTALFEGGHRVPFFIRWPDGDLSGPREIDDPAQAQDVLPTLIELAKLPNPQDVTFDGVSLAKLLRGEQETLADRMMVVQYSRPPTPVPRKWDAAIIWKRWRLINNASLYDLDADPRQTTNVITAYPDVVTQMRLHYEAWWKRVSPTVNVFSRLPIGSDAANPVQLASTEWRNVLLDKQAGVRSAPVKNGPWTLQVESAADYRIELRRWPAEANAAITAGVPAYTAVDGTYAAGKALPIARARLKVAGFDQTVPVTATDKAISFTVNLPVGPTDLQTWFLDANGKLLTGAYYVSVTRL